MLKDLSVGFLGKFLWIFVFGYVFEDFVIVWLCKVGFDFCMCNCYGDQFGFLVVGGCVQGYVDGVVVVVLNGMVVLVFWECKLVNVKNWWEIVKYGVGKVKLVYVVQIVFYQVYFDLIEVFVFFIVINKDICEIWYEFVLFDVVFVQFVSDKVVMILCVCDVGEFFFCYMVDFDYFECCFCVWWEWCWV